MLSPNEILQATQTILRLLDKFSAPVYDKYGLTQYEANVLLYLHNNPSKDTATDIVEFRHLPKANVSKAVESLIRKDLLSRLQDSGDRRRIHLNLRPGADRIITELSAAMDGFVSELFSDFSAGERELYAEMNLRIWRNAGKGLETSE